MSTVAVNWLMSVAVIFSQFTRPYFSLNLNKGGIGMLFAENILSLLSDTLAITDLDNGSTTLPGRFVKCS